MSPHAIWYGDGPAAHIVRTALAPAGRIYGAVTSIRNHLYDTGRLRMHPSIVPVLSVGNVTVGGTGKTPFAAYLIARLREMRRRPAVVMRGYGRDESLLHQRLNTGVRVYAMPDRVAGIARAAADGADVVVLDDGFQHRRAGRTLDIVLFSAEQWRDDLALLPAGPLREPLEGLRRAGVIVVTSKSATAETVSQVMSRMRGIAHGVPIAAARFRMDSLIDSRTGVSLSVQALGGADVLAGAGLADPFSFVRQLEQLGARVTARMYPDHHAFTASDCADLAREATHHKYVVSTGKDAVKLGPVWPGKGTPLWYVSQAVAITHGECAITDAIRDALSR